MFLRELIKEEVKPNAYERLKAEFPNLNIVLRFVPGAAQAMALADAASAVDMYQKTIADIEAKYPTIVNTLKPDPHLHNISADPDEISSLDKGMDPAEEDYHPNDTPPGPETKPTMPAGTVRVDVDDVYDWYKLGQHISNMKGLGKHDFGQGPPSTIFSFGSEEEEHKYIDALKKTGLTTTDIDPVDPKQPKGMPRQKTDPTYNVGEAKKRKRKKVKGAAYGPGPYGGYGYYTGYSGDSGSGEGGGDGGGMEENFADGKNPQDKGDSKRHGINTKSSVSSLRKTAKQGGRKGQLAHWLANMKAGRQKTNESTEDKFDFQIFKDFFPIAMKVLKINKLPKINLVMQVDDETQPTFGRFDHGNVIIDLGMANRHPIDILRTLAHELVHFKQYLNDELGPDSGETGSPEENQAHEVAGVIMRHFNKQHRHYFHSRPLEL